jgi:sialidase-1
MSLIALPSRLAASPAARLAAGLAPAAFAAAAALAPPAAAAAPAAPFFEQTDLFEVGQEGYLSYRIPCLVVTPKGTVIAINSARRAVSDWAKIDLMMRRSTDGGKTWRERTVIAGAPGKVTVDNPVMIVNRKTGGLHFLYQTNYARVFHKTSADDGATWGEPVEITPQLSGFRAKYNYNWNVIAPGPGHAIQLENGRLLVPVWLCNSGTKAHRPSVVATIYSDDHGETWHCGEILPDTLKNMNETAAVQLDDGRVALYMRNEEPGAYRHAVSYSRDGATGWTRPALHPELYSPISFATVARLSSGRSAAGGPAGKSRLLYVHPCNPDDTAVIRAAWGARARARVTVRLSYDEGKTWPVAKTLDPGRGGYADIAVAPDGTIHCLYERGFVEGNNLNTRFLSAARFNLEWLTDGKDSLK